MSSHPWTIRRLLEWTPGFFEKKGVDQPRLSAELLLSHVLGVPRIRLYTDYNRTLSEQHLAEYRDLVRRAAEQEPIAYATGKAHFFGLELEVTRDVLIPRPDTETLVEHVLQTARREPGLSSPRVLDLCTGSGCIALAIASTAKTAQVVAIDISEKATAVAKRNTQRLNLASRVEILTGDLFGPVSTLADPGPFDLIVSNPPYIPTRQIPELDRSVRDFEPHLALDGGPDGLHIHRRILEKAPDHLKPGGRIYLEIAFDQGPPARELFAQYPAFENIKILTDAGARDRVATAQHVARP